MDAAFSDSKEIDFNKTLIKQIPNGMLEKFMKTSEEGSKHKKKSKS